jgi:hypothetical protein
MRLLLWEADRRRIDGKKLALHKLNSNAVDLILKECGSTCGILSAYAQENRLSYNGRGVS